MDEEIYGDEDAISCATGVTVKEGDTVTVMLVDGVPTVIASSSSETTASKTAAHFWHDGEGAHVSEADNSVEGNNILIDTDSVDIRNGTNVLASFSSSGMDVNPNAGVGEVRSHFGKGEFRLDYNGLTQGVYSSPGKLVAYGPDMETAYAAQGVYFGVQQGCSITGRPITSSDGSLVRLMSITSNEYSIGNPDKFVSALGISDSIVESGTKGGWNYVKWPSGLMVCATHIDDNNTAITTSANGIYRSDTKSVSYPFTFASAPAVTLSPSGSTSGIFAWQTASYLATCQYRYGLHASNTPATLSMNIVAVGRWK